MLTSFTKQSRFYIPIKLHFKQRLCTKKLSNYKFRLPDDISDGLSEIQSLVTQLRGLGETISDKMVEEVILSALPSSFRTFVTVWKGIDVKERSVTNLINRIMGLKTTKSLMCQMIKPYLWAIAVKVDTSIIIIVPISKALRNCNKLALRDRLVIKKVKLVVTRKLSLLQETRSFHGRVQGLAEKEC